MGSCAGEIALALNHPKTIREIEDRIGVDMRRFTSGTHQQDPSKDLQRDSKHVLGILVVEKLSTCCDKLVS